MGVVDMVETMGGTGARWAVAPAPSCLEAAFWLHHLRIAECLLAIIIITIVPSLFTVYLPCESHRCSGLLLLMWPGMGHSHALGST